MTPEQRIANALDSVRSRIARPDILSAQDFQHSGLNDEQNELYNMYMRFYFINGMIGDTLQRISQLQGITMPGGGGDRDEYMSGINGAADMIQGWADILRKTAKSTKVEG